MKKILILFLLMLPAFIGHSQISDPDLQKLRQYEDTLATMARVMVQSDKEDVRVTLAYNLIPKLLSALKTPSSFQYPFDSVKGISIVYPEDRTFRIFTWSLEMASGNYRHFGAIQMNQPELKLFPLFDASDFMMVNMDTIADNNSWYGAHYYNIITKEHGGRTFYYLFGIDQNDQVSTKKVLDVMHFRHEKPFFGAPHFMTPEPNGGLGVHNRFWIEYSKGAAASLNYYPEKKMIIFDHLTPKNPMAVGLYSQYIPDGTYQGFEWNEKQGKWVHVDKVFHEAINENDNPPVPHPVDFGAEKEKNNYKK